MGVAPRLPAGSNLPCNFAVVHSNGTTLHYAYYHNGVLAEAGDVYYTASNLPLAFHGLQLSMETGGRWTITALGPCYSIQDAGLVKHAAQEVISAWVYSTGFNQETVYWR